MGGTKLLVCENSPVCLSFSFVFTELSLNMLWFGCPEHSCRIFTMFTHLNLLLLCLFTFSETSTIPVTGKKGSNVTLPCQYEASKISHINLSRFSKIIPVCENEECESGNGRVFKEGSCDIIIKDLIFSDAGKYILRVYNDDGQKVLKRIYQLCIHDEISVKKGEQLKMDVLLVNADKVQHQGRRSTGWKEDWKSSEGVQNDRMTFRDGKLIISNFTSTDAGTYEVLDSEGEILIMFTVKGERRSVDVQKYYFKAFKHVQAESLTIQYHPQNLVQDQWIN
ncbi:uncharacterized protein LOC125275942 [Megalobrama amblycephala]|uniref:uncharacterized protein LOC125275942 n=1 Tax=Megalobrama amblycephala TaxID=75352 RepID=UPI00201449E3|nr:uncharacterized protein LOC125275942 [Megalobrama amblycephala]